MKKYIVLDKFFNDIFIIDEYNKDNLKIGDNVLVLSDYTCDNEIHPFNLTTMRPSIEYINDIGKNNLYLSKNIDDDFGSLKIHIDWKFIFKVKKIDKDVSLKILDFYNINGFPPAPDDYLLPTYSGFNQYIKLYYDHYGFYPSDKFLDKLKENFIFLKKS